MTANGVKAVIIFGASEWPNDPDRFVGAQQFHNSAAHFRQYCLSPAGLNLRPDAVLDLFDDDRPASSQDRNIYKFLTGFEARSGLPLTDIIIYYVGHGTFSESDRTYCLLVRDTNSDNIGASAYRITSLARTMQVSAPHCRKYIILDACFSGSAVIPMSSVDDKIEMEMRDAAVGEGTAFFCAASWKDAALTQKSEEYTMFSGALVEVLQNGVAGAGPTLSLTDLYQSVRQTIRDRYKSFGVNAELHVPDQRDGDVSRIGLFPNSAKSIEREPTPPKPPKSDDKPARGTKERDPPRAIKIIAAVLATVFLATLGLIAWTAYRTPSPNWLPSGHLEQDGQSENSASLPLNIPAGLTVRQISQTLMDHKELEGSPPDPLPPEGSLHPGVFTYSRGTQRSDLMRQMGEQQRELVDKIWQDRDPDVPLKSKEELVVLASIVAKETDIDDERPHIASVFLNRLSKGMHLQSDPTVIYGLFGGEGPSGDWKMSEDDLRKPTPYNTYLIGGLPPMPIANPSRPSLDAVAHPAKTQDLYFVADGRGEHTFASTLDEHNANVKRWREIQGTQDSSNQ
ncbi:endolytic transglycosylase MltG [Rhizobium ruizarguesonis]